MKKETKKIIYSIVIPLFVVMAMWIVKLVEFSLDLNFSKYGIYPLKVEGLRGVFLSPFIHGSFKHLLSNTFVFFFLSTALFYFYNRISFKVLAMLYIAPGLTVWLIGREAYHIGISGIVYGLAAFLFFSGLFNKRKILSIVSLLVVFLYGGIVWGMLPGREGISWESHLSGFAWGLLTSVSFIGESKRKFKKKTKITVSEEEFSNYSISNDVYKDYKYFYKEENDE